MLASCFRTHSVLRVGDKEINKRQPADHLGGLLPSPSLSNMAQRETNEKSWIPNVSGLLKQQEIFLKICLNVKPVIQTKGILKSRLKSLGLDGFVFLGYIKQALDLAPHGN